MEPGKSKKAFKGCSICIKNDLIEIALYYLGAISVIFYYSKTIMTSGAKLFMQKSLLFH